MVFCDYCGDRAELVTGRQVYPHLPDLWEKQVYQCTPCKARVGCHPGTTKPLGRLANASLRDAKMKAHSAFDPMWKTHRMKRKAAYKWLAERLGINPNDCHIGMFDEAMCARVVEVCANP